MNTLFLTPEKHDKRLKIFTPLLQTRNDVILSIPQREQENLNCAGF